MEPSSEWSAGRRSENNASGERGPGGGPGMEIERRIGSGIGSLFDFRPCLCPLIRDSDPCTIVDVDSDSGRDLVFGRSYVLGPASGAAFENSSFRKCGAWEDGVRATVRPSADEDSIADSGRECTRQIKEVKCHQPKPPESRCCSRSSRPVPLLSPIQLCQETRPLWCQGSSRRPEALSEGPELMYRNPGPAPIATVRPIQLFTLARSINDRPTLSDPTQSTDVPSVFLANTLRENKNVFKLVPSLTMSTKSPSIRRYNVVAKEVRLYGLFLAAWSSSFGWELRQHAAQEGVPPLMLLDTKEKVSAPQEAFS
ncbi:hypothetical protein EVAR_25178_1 [Eumeta japonica]|uniref:Uncharacterized protein n=1 Tax=Eumeta variegata TaxID=151549 RepID=A0A4C1VS24_EUMVA|nr:hypothetical protein EVAR_25178_1 [Eumeta japonica]